jgi:outer membrane receptor for ferrienterochelin and colicin
VFGNSVDAESQQYGGIAGLVQEMENGWNADFSYMYNFSSTEADNFDLFTNEFTGNLSTESEIQALELVFDGPFSLGESNASAAFGVAYREEVFDDVKSLEVTGIEGLLDREAAAVFGEVWWPLFTPADERTGLNRLELSFSLRYEHYSDFGDTTDPKVGVLWAPTEDLNLRTTWSTSFRAPLLSELNENNQSSNLSYLEDADGNRLVTLLARGNNAELTQETATNWTTGIDYEPTYVPGLKLSMTYFDIDFKDRIGLPPVGTRSLIDPQFSPLLTYNPEPALIDRFTQVNFYNQTTLPYPGFGPPAAAEDTDVFIDGRLRNSASTRTRGIDLNLNYGFENSAGVWQLSLYSSYLIDMINKLTEQSPPEQQLNQPFYPVDLKNRLGINWQSNEGNLASSLYVNYTDSYKGNAYAPMDIDSFTTVDLNLSYDTGYAAGFLGGMQFSLNIQNLFDEDPPFKDGEGTGFNFDPNNASPLGRFVSLNVVKQW